MSAQEIIAELAQLSQPELEQVDVQLHALLRSRCSESAKTWSEALLEVAGSAHGLPEDFAQNHDHYLHGTPQR